jgi:hypothetical protein
MPKALQISETVRDTSSAILLNICISFGRPPYLPRFLADSSPPVSFSDESYPEFRYCSGEMKSELSPVVVVSLLS